MGGGGIGIGGWGGIGGGATGWGVAVGTGGRKLSVKSFFGAASVDLMNLSAIFSYGELIAGG